MGSAVNWRIRDASNEYSAFNAPIINLTGANYAATLGLITTLQNALIAIILGNVAGRSIAAEQTAINDTPVANAFAQRELKAMISYRGSVNNELRRSEVPTPDLQYLIPGTDLFDIVTAGPMLTFVNAFEALAAVDGVGTVTVEEIRFVGRNL